MPAEIPLVDLAAWFEGAPAERREIAEEVDTHLRRVGFLVVVGHGIDPSVTDRARSAVLEFFRLPPEVKERHRHLGGPYRGWVPMGAESNAGAYGADGPPDLKETFAVGPPSAPAELVAAAPRWYAPTPWPEEVPHLEEAVTAFHLAAGRLADELLVLLATALDQPPDALTRFCRHPMATSSLNWYVPRRLVGDVAEGQYRIGPHTDYGTVTVLDRQPGLGGLEVLVDGAWVTAPWVPGSLTINTGLLMRRWSDDRWQPNPHRVLAPPADDPDEELVSLVFFHDPDHDAVIEPLAGCVGPDGPRYEPVIAGEHLGAMLDALAVDAATGPPTS